MSRTLPQLHAITNDAVLALPDLEGRARALAEAGVVALHARSGTLTGAALLDRIRTLGRSGAPLIVNDRADLVAHTGAIGLHLPATGLPTVDARALVGPEVLLGRSTHNPDEALRAREEGADYVFLGPVWETPSHPGTPGIGLHALRAAAAAHVVAIGGVTPERAQECRDAGAVGVAAISALWHATDPGSAARAMLLSFDSDGE